MIKKKLYTVYIHVYLYRYFIHIAIQWAHYPDSKMLLHRWVHNTHTCNTFMIREAAFS